MSIYKDFVADYLKGVEPDEPVIAKNMREFAISNNIPTMTALEGKFLQMIVTISGTKDILELGTGLGYSSFWMAGASNVSKLITIEYNGEYAERASGFLNDAGLEKVAILQGNTQDLLPGMTGHFDMVFMDHFKDYYLSDLEVCVEFLRKDGIFLAHNALEGGWDTGSAEGDLQSEKLKKFHEAFLAHPDMDSIILPVGEGFAFGVKKTEPQTRTFKLKSNT